VNGGSRGNTGRDENVLARFGYRQELERSLGSFSSFAAGFSYISILTGVFQMFYLGFGAGGPAFLWSWPLVLVGQFLVALGFAELASRYPLSGGVYQWAKLVGSPSLGWMTGWLYLACLVVTLAAVAMALQGTLPQISPVFQLVGSSENPRDAALNAVVLGTAIIGLSTALNSVGVRAMAWVNNLGVFAEITGIVLLVALLAFRAKAGSVPLLFTTGGRGSGLGYASAFLASAALTASYVLYGFDTAGTLAEETHDPSRLAPRAILQALVAAGAAGFLVLLLGLLAAPDLAAPILGKQNGGLPWIVKQTLGPGLGTLFLCDVAFAIVVCVLAVHAGTVRLAFAMARDGKLPFSGALSSVSASSRTPVAPAIVIGTLAIGIMVANVDVPKMVELVTMVAVLWANLAYLVVTAALFYRRWRGELGEGSFSLGRWGIAINGLSTLWSLFMVLNVGWPRAEVYGPEAKHRFAPCLLTLGLLALGLVVRYFASDAAGARRLTRERVTA
jgi:urea carboxylase system permease